MTKMSVGRSCGTVIEKKWRTRAGAVDRGGLVVVARDGLHRGEEDEGVVAGPAEVDHRRDRDVAGEGVGVPRIGSRPMLPEDGVDEAVLVAEQVAEDQGDRDGGHDVGQQHAHPPEGLGAEVRGRAPRR